MNTLFCIKAIIWLLIAGLTFCSSWLLYPSLSPTHSTITAYHIIWGGALKAITLYIVLAIICIVRWRYWSSVISGIAALILLLLSWQNLLAISTVFDSLGQALPFLLTLCLLVQLILSKIILKKVLSPRHHHTVDKD